MIEFALFLNTLAMISCGIAAGMNFSRDNTVAGLSMVSLFIVNLVCFAVNLGRLVG